MRRRPVPTHEGLAGGAIMCQAWLRAARQLAAAGGHLEPLTFPVSRSPSVHRGDPVTVNLHCGGLARLRSHLAGGSAPAAPCDSSGISALWKRAKGAGAPGAPGRKSASSFSASFQLTAPPHGGPQTRADRRTTQDRTEKHNDTSRRPVGQHRPRPEQQY